VKRLLSDAELIDSYWHFGCLSGELSSEGDYILHRLGDRDVVLYHDGNEVIAFDNRCPHRGTKFFDAPSGHERAVCRYHGWSFTKGRLVIPLESELASDCSRPQLNRYRTEWCGTFLFFGIHPRSELVEQLGEQLYAYVESLSFDCRAREDVNQYVYECPWQVAVENALEPQHLPFIHKATLNKLDLQNCRNLYWGVNSGVFFDIGNPSIKKLLSRIEAYYDRGNAFHPGYMSIYLFPFGFISSTGGASYSIQTFFPRTGQTSWFTARLYSVRLSDVKYQEADRALIRSAVEMNRLVFEEDHEICKRISADAWKESLDRCLYQSEEKVSAFRKNLHTVHI
jgi:phenylpropionate dioxygenase-like ring-hydroxylating dioxygenase large terminal subunit